MFVHDVTARREFRRIFRSARKIARVSEITREIAKTWQKGPN